VRVVITGGSGFIGSHLSERFLNDGHEVVCLDNFITGAARNTEHLLERPSFTRIECDVSREISVDGPVDAVLHFASPASPIGYMRLPLETLHAGSSATFHCAELARRHSARLLMASTSEVYGDPLEHPQSESYWGNVNSIGPRSVYDDGRSLPTFCWQALRDEPITVFGDGSQTRSFCYVSDLVEGICRLLASDEHMPVNIGNPNEISIRGLVEEIIELTGSRSTVEYHDLPQDDPKIRCPDITRAKSLLSWEPVSIEGKVCGTPSSIFAGNSPAYNLQSWPIWFYA